MVKKFEAETGIQVIIDTYDSNETLLAKLQAAGGSTGYDLAVPSQHFVEIMIKEGLLRKFLELKTCQIINMLQSNFKIHPLIPCKNIQHHIKWVLPICFRADSIQVMDHL